MENVHHSWRKLVFLAKKLHSKSKHFQKGGHLLKKSWVLANFFYLTFL